MIETLARFLFERQARTFNDHPGALEEVWETDEGVRTFWLDEAGAILGFLMPQADVD